MDATQSQIETVVTYYDNGQLALQADRQNNQLHGQVLAYDEAGQLIQTASYAFGKLHGELVIYQAGKKTSSVFYLEGIKHGIARLFYDNQQVQLEEHYEYGQLQGDAIYYNPDGKPIRVCHYWQGKLHGKSISFYPNGQPQEKSYYEYGEIKGPVYYYALDGSLLNQTTTEQEAA